MSNFPPDRTETDAGYTVPSSSAQLLLTADHQVTDRSVDEHGVLPSSVQVLPTADKIVKQSSEEPSVEHAFSAELLSDSFASTNVLGGEELDSFRVSDLDSESLRKEVGACTHVNKSGDSDDSGDEDFGSEENMEDLERIIQPGKADYFQALSELQRMATVPDQEEGEYLAQLKAECQLIRHRTQESLGEIAANKKITLNSLIKTGEDLVAFTGINFALLFSLVTVVEEYEAISGQSNQFVLSVQDRLLLSY